MAQGEEAMSAIQALKDQLREMQYKQSLLINDDGIVQLFSRYEYEQLAIHAADIRKGIQLLEDIAKDKDKK